MLRFKTLRIKMDKKTDLVSDFQSEKTWLFLYLKTSLISNDVLQQCFSLQTSLSLLCNSKTWRHFTRNQPHHKNYFPSVLFQSAITFPIIQYAVSLSRLRPFSEKVSVVHYSVKHNELNLVRGNSSFHDDKRHRFTGAVRWRQLYRGVPVKFGKGGLRIYLALDNFPSLLREQMWNAGER